MPEKAPIRDSIGDNELKVYYTGEVNSDLDNSVILALERLGYGFLSMTHVYDYIHRMSFVKER